MVGRDKVALSLEMDLNRECVCKGCGARCSSIFDVEVLFSRDGKKCGLNIWSLFSYCKEYDKAVRDVMEYLEDKYGLIGGCWEKFNDVGDSCVIMYEGLTESDLNRVYAISKLSGI